VSPEEPKQPAVSILVSYYNGTRFLETFLRNVSEQSIAPQVELVFIGCLMTGEEVAAVERLRESGSVHGVVCHNLETLETQPVCWNLAIKHASADFCCIWNVDDIRTGRSLEKLLEGLGTGSTDRPVGAAYGMFVVSSQYQQRSGRLVDHRFYPEEEYLRSMLLGPFFMFRKALCERVGYFDEQFRCAADYDFAIRLARVSDIKFVDYVDGYFLDEGRGISTSGDGVQPTERTVVEHRFGLFDKVEQPWVQAALTRYKVTLMRNYGEWVSIP
jgi:GT2 family glycosyltransferase